MKRRVVVFSLAFVALAACCGAFAVPPPTEVRAVTTDPATPKAASGEAIACRSDADCPHLACGPCEAGAPITPAMIGGPECAVNPCLDASSVCSAEHRCEIGPGTRKNPKVWKRPSN